MAEVEAAAATSVEEEEARIETSYLLLSLFPSFPFPNRRKRPSLPSFAVFFFFYFFSRAHPLARLQLRRSFSPSNSGLFLLRCSASPSPSPSFSRSLLIRDSHLSPQPQPPLLGFFLSVLPPRSFLFFSSLLSFCAAPRVARGQ